MKILRWVPVFIWVLIICYLSFSSLEKLPVPKIFSIDKIGHFGMYFIMEFLLYYPLQEKVRQFKIASLLAMLFSLSVEFIQHFFVYNRHGELMDFVANVVGLIFAYWLISKRKKLNIKVT